MARYLDVESWPRRQHFEFFRDFELPFFHLCACVDVTRRVAWCREKGRPSFFLASLHAALLAANEEESLRYRLRGDRVLVHERIDAGSTVLLADETFRFAYFPFDEDLGRFAQRGKAELERARSNPDLIPSQGRDDLIHFSIVPWLHFTGLAHARRLDKDDSVPKIVFGRYEEREGRLQMPVSVEAHHSLLDGLHVARFFQRFQKRLDADCG